MSFLPVLTWLLGFNGVARAECPADAAHFQAHVKAAQAAYAGFDVPGFQTQAVALQEDVPCLTEELDAPTVAQVHLIEALAALLDKDEPRMRASFQGLRATDPTFQLSADLAPAGSQQRSVFESVATLPVSKPRPITRGGLYVWVDGKPNARAVPTRRAALVQVRSDSEGLRGWYLEGGKLPADLLEAVTEPQAEPPAKAEPSAKAEPRAASTAQAQPAPRKSRVSRSMLLAGAAAGVASGVALVAATNARDEFYTTSPENVQAAYDTNRALGFTGYGLGAAAVGLGVTAMVVGRW
jgi:hypothetical protein